MLLILFGYEMDRLKYWFFEKFGKRILDQVHLGDYNIISRRGWLFMGREFWYDKDYE